MVDPSPASVLCVDDEPDFREWTRRTLASRFDVTVASSASEAIRHVETRGPVEVVLSDFKMPGEDGLGLLGLFQERWPDTVRVLVTAHGNFAVAIAAVNRNHIFRFLEKPCSVQDLVGTVGSSVEQHRLVTSERLLLEKTVHGSIKMLSELMAFSDPAAFGRGQRIRKQAGRLAEAVGEPARWEIEAAAMLSQIGSVLLPRQVVGKIDQGEKLDAREQQLVEELPLLAERLLGEIPRLEGVRAILRYQGTRFDGNASPEGEDTAGNRIPIGARILKLLVDYDQLDREGVPPETLLEILTERSGWYDPVLLDALAQLGSSEPTRTKLESVSVSELRAGMVVVDGVVSSDGRILLSRGQELSERAVEALRGFAQNMGVKEPIRALVRD